MRKTPFVFFLSLLLWAAPAFAQSPAPPGPKDLFRVEGDFFATRYLYHGYEVHSLDSIREIISASGDREALGLVEASQRDRVLGMVFFGAALVSAAVGLSISLDDGNRDEALPQGLVAGSFAAGGLGLCMDWLSGVDESNAVKIYNRALQAP